MSRLATLLVLCALSSGCTLNGLVSKNYVSMLEQRSFQAPHPIARELNYVVVANSNIDGHLGNALVTSTYPKGADVAQHFTAPSTVQVTVPTSQAAEQSYAAAEEASRRGDHRGAADHLSVGIANEESSLAMQRTMSTSIGALNIYMGTMSALSGLANMWHQQTGQQLSAHLQTQTGCIGEEAPEGTVLHLYVSELTHGKSFTLTSRSEIVVRAVLEDANGEKRAVDRAVEFRMNFDPPEERKGDYVKQTPETRPRIESDIIDPTNPWIAELTTVAIAAVEGLYASEEAH
ncbi:MAG: hypothetical protein AAF517_18355 [Planctomycetota bacterium]